MSARRNLRPGKNVLVIFNPVAGRRRHLFFTKTLKKMSDLGLHVELKATTGPGDARAIAEEASNRRSDGSDTAPDLVVAAGGDGTINEVVNGLAGSGLPLGIIPLGTANVLAREIGLRQRSGDIARLLAGGEARDVFPGEVLTDNGPRRFLMMVGAGYDANVVSRVNVKLKYRWGKIAYFVAGMTELFARPQTAFDMVIDGERHQAGWAVISKGKRYAGNFLLARAASLQDDHMVACVFPGRRRVDIARYLVAIGLGRVHRLRDAKLLKCQEVEINGPASVRTEMDGDLFGHTPARLQVAATPIALVQPA